MLVQGPGLLAQDGLPGWTILDPCLAALGAGRPPSSRTLGAPRLRAMPGVGALYSPSMISSFTLWSSRTTSSRISWWEQSLGVKGQTAEEKWP